MSTEDQDYKTGAGMMSQLGNVCEHGTLARQCYICELKEELANVHKTREAIEKERTELVHLLAKERDDFGKKETELLSLLRKYREALEEIASHVCHPDCNHQEVAKAALEDTK